MGLLRMDSTPPGFLAEAPEMTKDRAFAMAGSAATMRPKATDHLHQHRRVHAARCRRSRRSRRHGHSCRLHDGRQVRLELAQRRVVEHQRLRQLDVAAETGRQTVTELHRPKRVQAGLHQRLVARHARKQLRRNLANHGRHVDAARDRCCGRRGDRR